MVTAADVYIPDGTDEGRAVERTTHLAIGAHQDDLEILALTAIHECADHDDRWFSGLVCSDGAGSPRSGPYGGTSNEEMVAIRRQEQREAADMGSYSAVVQLGIPSGAVRSLDDEFVQAVAAWIARCGPREIVTHNLADRHPTHVATAVAVVKALRGLPKAQHPDRLLGVEAWRSLDWLTDDYRVELTSSGSERMAAELLEVFDSQISGGKRYDLAFVGRRRANATLSSPHEIDSEDQVSLAMDMTPLVREPERSPAEFVLDRVDSFRAEVAEALQPFDD